MIVVVSAKTPCTTPDVLTVAMPVLRLAHVPPAGASDKVVDAPGQVFVTPDIGAGNATTVILCVVIQPSSVVYVMVAAPAPVPVINPLVMSIVAILLALLDQEPPPIMSAR